MTIEKRKEAIKTVLDAYKILSDINMATGKALEEDKGICDREILCRFLEDIQILIGSHVQDIDSIARIDGFKIKEYQLVEGEEVIVTHWDRILEYMEATLELENS